MADILTVKVEAPGVAEFLDKFSGEVSQIVASAVLAEREACAAIADSEANAECIDPYCCELLARRIAESIRARHGYAKRIVPDTVQQGIPANHPLLNKPQAYMVIGNGVCRGVYRVRRDAEEIVTYCDGEFSIVPLYAAGE